jgi:hypothetical protein
MSQVELPLVREPARSVVPIETIRAQKTYAGAFTLACSVSGLEDKEIYLAIDIDAGYFSNIKKGRATLQGDLVAKFCELVGNTILPEWTAYQVGCTLTMIKSEAERRAEAAEARAAQAEAENKLMRQLLQGRAA